MKAKRIALICLVVLTAILGIIFWRNDVRAPIRQEYKPGIPVDKQNFEGWRLDWEKHRQN
jgi:hypothetical protein